MTPGSSDYATLDAWAGSLGNDDIIATAEQGRALVIALCRTFDDQLDAVQRRCLAVAGRFGDQCTAEELADWTVVKHRIGEETPRLISETRLPSVVHLPPDQARNRLVFAACVAEPGPVDWQLIEYLSLWAEDAEIPIEQCLDIFRDHIPRFDQAISNARASFGSMAT